MQAHITRGRLFGVQIGLHDTWLLLALLLLFSLARHWQAVHATWGQGIVWALATGTALLFFAALVAPMTDHVAHASLAASTACSTSAAPAWWTVASTC
jgi:hypothetical protein